jgi:predicted transcriptional regulator
MSDNLRRDDLLEFTTEIVSSHVSNNTISIEDLPKLIKSVYETIISLNKGESCQEGLTPAVPVKKSITPDYIICLEDGKKLKMLKRHLKSAYDMTPEEYRQRWGLSSDYPMVAPNYAAKRSSLAKEIGLGTMPK